jgi:hypothetical protein
VKGCLGAVQCGGEKWYQNGTKRGSLRSSSAFCKVGKEGKEGKGERGTGLENPMIVGNERCRSDRLEGEGRWCGRGARQITHLSWSLVCCGCLDHAIHLQASSRFSLSTTHTMGRKGRESHKVAVQNGGIRRYTKGKMSGN